MLFYTPVSKSTHMLFLFGFQIQTSVRVKKRIGYARMYTYVPTMM